MAWRMYRLDERFPVSTASHTQTHRAPQHVTLANGGTQQASGSRLMYG